MTTLKQELSGNRLARRRRLAVLFLLCTSGLTLSASAASVVKESRTEVIPTTVDHILSVLSSSDICDKGCKYTSPDVVREVKLSQRAKKNEFYKWSHINNTKDTKFFMHYVITRGAAATDTTRVKLRSLTKEHDAELIRELEKETGFVHAPLFDVAHTEYVIKPLDGKCEVSVNASTQISGLVGMFAGTVKSGMQKTIAQLFKNFRR